MTYLTQILREIDLSSGANPNQDSSVKKKYLPSPEIFRQINSLKTDLLILSQNFCHKWERVNSRERTAVWKNEKFPLTEKNIS